MNIYFVGETDKQMSREASNIIKDRLSSGSHNTLVEKIIDEFCQIFAPRGNIIYVSERSKKWAYFGAESLRDLGIEIEEHKKMPDLITHHPATNRLILVAAVTGYGPINSKRLQKLKSLFAGSKAALVFVTAFPTRHELMNHLNDIAWETIVWVADAPTHLIHFDGERFLGPYEE